MRHSSVHLPYGDKDLSIAIPEQNLLDVITPKSVGLDGNLSTSDKTTDQDQIIRKALALPIGSAPLRKLVRPGQRIAIVTSDVTRPCPSATLIPYILDELEAAGVNIPQDVLIVIALGLHRLMTPQEIGWLVGSGLSSTVLCILSLVGRKAGWGLVISDQELVIRHL